MLAGGDNVIEQERRLPPWALFGLDAGARPRPFVGVAQTWFWTATTSENDPNGDISRAPVLPDWLKYLSKQSFKR